MLSIPFLRRRRRATASSSERKADRRGGARAAGRVVAPGQRRGAQRLPHRRERRREPAVGARRRDRRAHGRARWPTSRTARAPAPTSRWSTPSAARATPTRRSRWPRTRRGRRGSICCWRRARFRSSSAGLPLARLPSSPDFLSPRRLSDPPVCGGGLGRVPSATRPQGLPSPSLPPRTGEGTDLSWVGRLDRHRRQPPQRLRIPSNPALPPSCTTLPRSSTTARAVNPSATRTCCSTSTSATPLSSTMRRIVAASSCTRIGASPSIGSSSSSTRGLSISARAMASICCSPPDSWLPRLRRRSSSRGSSANTRRRSQWPGRATDVRCSSTVSDGNTQRSCGTQPSPARARRWLAIAPRSAVAECAGARRARA